MYCEKSGIIIVGAGVCKHHIFEANYMKGGADWSVIINNSQEFDGSDAGARPDEGKSWGKLNPYSSPVKLFSDATLVLPLIVGETFAKDPKRSERVSKEWLY